MNKLTCFIFIPLAAVLFSCGGVSQQDVCGCEALMEKMRLEETTLKIQDHMEYQAAKDKVMADHKTEFDRCMSIRKKAGERPYFKMSQKCN